MEGLIGYKLGMSRIFKDDGKSVPITVIKIEKNYVVQIKNNKNDGYCSLQLSTGVKKINKVKKTELGHFKKANLKVGKYLKEFRVHDINSFFVGQAISVDIFATIKKVDITGLSKGKGFAGTVKRWNFSIQDATHGNSLSHRVPGSIGQNQTPGRVFKGKKMSGRLGNEYVTIQNLDIVGIRKEDQLMFVKGSVPGNVKNFLIIKKSIKN